MAKRQHIVRDGETLANVSRQYYGVPSRTADIIRANPKLQYRQSTTNVDLSGNPLLEAGEVLTIQVDVSIAMMQNKTLPGVDPTTATLFINGVETPVPNGTTATIHYDAGCRTMTTSFSWDPMDPADRARWGKPTALPEFELFLGPKRLVGGVFDSIGYTSGSSAASRRVMLTGSSHTGVMLNSCIPFGAYPLERKGETLAQVLEWLCGIWGFKVEGSAAIDKAFRKIGIGNSERVWDVAASLAQQRGSVLQVDDTGYVVRVVNPIIGEPVAYLEHGVNGFDLPEIKYDLTTLHDTHIGHSETTKRPRDAQSIELGLLGNGSCTYHDLNNQDDGTSNESLEYMAFKSLRDFFTIPIRIPGGLINEQTGEYWEPGQIIGLKAPHAAIYSPSNFMIRWLRYTFGNDETRGVEAGIIPPETYMGRAMARMPWD